MDFILLYFYYYLYSCIISCVLWCVGCLLSYYQLFYHLCEDLILLTCSKITAQIKFDYLVDQSYM